MSGQRGKREKMMREKIMAIMTTTMAIMALLCIVGAASPSAFAFGITPGRTVISVLSPTGNGDGNATGTANQYRFSFRPLLAPEETGMIAVSAQGDLAPYIAFDKTLIDPAKGEGVSGTITVPANATPGEHGQEIIIQLLPNASAGTIAANLAVAGILAVKIPYPEEYLTLDWNADLDQASRILTFSIDAENLGNQTVTTTGMAIMLQEIENAGTPAAIPMTIATLPVPDVTIKPQAHAQATASYDGLATGRIPPGVYTAEVTAQYAGKSASKAAQLTIGAPIIGIASAVYAGGEGGSIKPIDITGTALWNRPLNGTLSVFMDNSTTPALTQEIALGQQFDQRVYLDTARTGAPKESLRAVIDAAGASATRDIAISSAAAPASNAQGRAAIAPGLLALLILGGTAVILALLFLFLRSRHHP